MRPSPSRLFALVVASTALVVTTASATPAADGVKRAERGLALVASGQSDDGRNRNVRVHNQTGWTMTGLSVSSGGSWTADLLGSRTLDAGRSAVVAIDDGTGACRYSLRARFDNGETLERAGINSCQIADYYFTR